MGQKVNPICLRLGISRDWRSKWFAPNRRIFVQYLQEDRRVKELLARQLASAAVSKVVIERSPERVRVIIHTARPGILIGRRGENIQRLQDAVQAIVGVHQQLKIDYVEITNPGTEAKLIADSVAFQLVKRIAFRRAMKRAVQQAMEAGAKGVKVVCNGRLAGSEMKRSEVYRAGTVPLGTFRADIDFATGTAHTAAGCIGTKVWVCRGMLSDRPEAQAAAAGAARSDVGRGRIVGQSAKPVAETGGAPASVPPAQTPTAGSEQKAPLPKSEQPSEPPASDPDTRASKETTSS